MWRLVGYYIGDSGFVYKDTGLLEKVEFLENFLDIWWGDLRLGGPGAGTGSTVPFTFGTLLAREILYPVLA